MSFHGFALGIFYFIFFSKIKNTVLWVHFISCLQRVFSFLTKVLVMYFSSAHFKFCFCTGLKLILFAKLLHKRNMILYILS